MRRCNAVCCERASFTLARDRWARECGTDTEGTHSARLSFSLRASAFNSRAAITRTDIVANGRSADDPVGMPATGEESGSSVLQSRICEHCRIARIGKGFTADFTDFFRRNFFHPYPSVKSVVYSPSHPRELAEVSIRRRLGPILGCIPPIVFRRLSPSLPSCPLPTVQNSNQQNAKKMQH